MGYQFLEMFKLTSFGEIGELIIGAITTPFKTIGSIITPILKGLGSTISTIFSFILTPVGSVVAAFVIIGAALYDLWNNCEWFRDGLTDLWENTLQPIIEG